MPLCDFKPGSRNTGTGTQGQRVISLARSRFVTEESRTRLQGQGDNPPDISHRALPAVLSQRRQVD